MQVSSQSYSDTVKKGKIISQSVEKGKTVEEDTKIMVVVSKGIEPVTVPNVIGNAKDTAIVKKRFNKKCKEETMERKRRAVAAAKRRVTKRKK